MMKRKIAALLAAVMIGTTILAGCGSGGSSEGASAASAAASEAVSAASEPSADTASESASDAAEESVSDAAAESASDTAEESVSDAAEAASDTAAVSGESGAASEGAVLEDGVYIADFNTDSSMFHVNEAYDGKGTLTVEGGKMTIHISLVSKNIVNMYPGLAEDAQKDGAELLEPTTDNVVYSDGTSDEVYGFDVPVPAIDEEFDCAIIGTKGKWYDHKVSVSNPEEYIE